MGTARTSRKVISMDSVHLYMCPPFSILNLYKKSNHHHRCIPLKLELSELPCLGCPRLPLPGTLGVGGRVKGGYGSRGDGPGWPRAAEQH